jgi:acetyl-CoA synthetase (ADP-forming)
MSHNMLDYFFSPKSIAIIGATANPKKFGNVVTSNILSNKKLKSKLFLVSYNTEEIMGCRCYKSLLDIDEKIDLVIILVPAKVVLQVVNDCIEKKVKGIIIVSSGFGEVDEKGKKVESIIAQKCKSAKVRVMGPNCVGIQNTEINLNASFIQMPKQGNISMISQSGSIGCALFYAMEPYGLGISKFANIGNAIDISFNEILEYFNDDDKTKLIALYLESINDGVRFFKVLKNSALSKPIVVLKGGKTHGGMEAASSHTGSIVTNYKIMKAVINQSNAILCETINDFITAINTLSLLSVPTGENIGVLTNSGGSAVLFTDMAESYGLKLVSFSNNLKKEIKPHLIPLVKMVNPLDMIASAAKEQYYRTTRAMLNDPDIDIVVAGCVIPPFLQMDADEHYKGVIQAWNETKRKKPIIPMFLFSENFKELRDYANKEKAPIYFTPEEAAFAIKVLIQRIRTNSQ